MNKLFSLITLAFCFSTAYAQNCNVFFNSGSDIIRSNDAIKLYSFSQDCLGEEQDYTIRLMGFTDTVGNQKKNQELAQARVDAVRDYLVDNGLDETLISTGTGGESAVAGTELLYNRRVEVYLDIIPKEVENVAVDEVVEPEFGSLEEYLDHIKPKPQTFRINCGKGGMLEGDKGTIVIIPSNAFVDSEGNPVEGEIEFDLTEYYSHADWFSDQLSTASQSNIIMSQGMVNIEARQGEEELSLADETSLELGFPKFSEETYNTFYGERDEFGAVVWERDESQKPRLLTADDIGVTTFDGEGLEIVDRNDAEARNDSLAYYGVYSEDFNTGQFSMLSEEQLLEWNLAQEEIRLEWEQSQEEQMQMNIALSDYYQVIGTSKLGYINCDRFLRTKKYYSYCLYHQLSPRGDYDYSSYYDFLEA